MAEDSRARAQPWPKGRLFEDFEVGQRFDHHWGRTLSESDTTLFTTLTLSFNPLYLNRAYARAHGHPDIVVNPQLVFNVVLGLSVEDCSEIGGPFLGVFDLVYDRPVYPGTTLVAHSETVDRRVSESNPANGVVTWRTEGFDGETGARLVGFRRSNLVRLRQPGGGGVSGPISRLTGAGAYFEDFTVGLVIKHARGKTVTPLENVLITNLTMNTAQGHFNAHMMAATPLGDVIVYGGVSFSLVLGLACQDCCENALEELGLDNIRLSRPVMHGDTLYAYSEVLEAVAAEREDAGVVTFRHFGYNQRDEQVAQVDRRALLKRRSHWADR